MQANLLMGFCNNHLASGNRESSYVFLRQVLSLRDQISELNQTISNLVNNQNDFYSKICEISQDNSKLLAENKYLRKQLYEYRLQSYNSL